MKRATKQKAAGSERPALVGTQPRSRLPLLFITSLPQGFRQRHLFDQVERYCMFVGYPRSGHSLVGSLLDAHPDVVISHELDSLRLMRFRFSRDQLYALILANERSFTASGRHWTNSDYHVPDQWHGSYRTLRVIGDKKGGQSTRRLRSNPELLDRLRRKVGVPIRVVHVVRNPFDNIASMKLRRTASLEEVTDDYFGLCNVMAGIGQYFARDESVTVRYESLVDDAPSSLRHLCSFLEVEPEEGFIRAAASAVRPEPSRSRDRLDWPPQLVAEIGRRIERYPHLEGYSFAD